MQVDWTRIKSTAIGSLSTLAIVAVIFFGAKWHKRVPDVEEEAKGKAAVAILLVDDSAPSIPQGLVLDSPLARAMLLAGKLQVGSITDKWTTDHKYDTLLAKAGGAPALLFLDSGGKCLCPCRFPTDVQAFDTLAAKYFTSLPPPLAPLKDEPIVTQGRELPVLQDAQGRRWIDDGHARMLTYKPSQQMFAAMPAYAASNPLFPQTEWSDINRRNMFGSPDWIYDQNGYGSCVGHGSVRSLRCIRVLAGMSDVKLSPMFTYTYVCGGADNGAYIPDVIPALTEHGTCSFDLLGEKFISTPGRLTAAQKTDAMRFTLDKAYRCDGANGWESLISALQTRRYVACFGFEVGNSFYKFDQYGVAGHSAGQGNHCVMCDGCRKLPDGRWVLDVANSWGYSSFGPWKNGRVYLDKQHLFGGGNQANVVVFRAAGRDPKDSHNPPVLVP